MRRFLFTFLLTLVTAGASHAAPPGMLTDASNAKLPDALNHLGLGVANTPQFLGINFESTLTPLVSLNANYFPSYSQKSNAIDIVHLSGAISNVASFRDAYYIELTDSDTTVYTNSISYYGLRIAVFGPNSGISSYTRAYKNYVALNPYAYCATPSTPINGFAAGCSGINTNAVQWAEGIGDNEFYAGNPSAASGGLGHSISLAAVQAILDNAYAVTDSNHTAYAFLASTVGSADFTATAAYGASGLGTYYSFIDAGGTKMVSGAANSAGIIMPGSFTAADYIGTIINYGYYNGNPAGGSFSKWVGNINGGQYQWVDGGVFVGTLDTGGFGSPAFNASGDTHTVGLYLGNTIAVASTYLTNTQVLFYLDSSNVIQLGFGHGGTPNAVVANGAFTIASLASGGTQCAELLSTGQITGTGGACSGSAGMTTNGSNATTAALANIATAATSAMVATVNITAKSFITAGDVNSIGLDLANNIAIVGDWSAQTWSLMYLNSGGSLVLGFGRGPGDYTPVELPGSFLLTSITGSTQCLEVLTTGQVQGTGTACGSASGGMTASGSNATGAALANILTAATSPATATVLISSTAFNANGDAVNVGLYLANNIAIASTYLGNTEVLFYLDASNVIQLGFGHSGTPNVVVSNGPFLDLNIASGGTQCVEALSTGQLAGTGAPCGGAGGMTTSGSNATSAAFGAIASVASGTVTASVQITTTAFSATGDGSSVGLYLANSVAISGTYSAQNWSMMYLNSGGTLVLGFGHSGSPLPTQVVGALLTNITGSSQCVRALSTGQLQGTGSDCGTGGGGMTTSASNATGAAVNNLFNANTNASLTLSATVTMTRVTLNGDGSSIAAFIANNTAIESTYSTTNENLLYLNSGGTEVVGYGQGSGPPGGIQLYGNTRVVSGNLNVDNALGVAGGVNVSSGTLYVGSSIQGAGGIFTSTGHGADTVSTGIFWGAGQQGITACTNHVASAGGIVYGSC